MKDLDTYELVKDKLDEMGIEQLVLLDDPIIIQLKNYKLEMAYMVYTENGYLNYFDGKNFRKVNFSRVLTISK